MLLILHPSREIALIWVEKLDAAQLKLPEIASAGSSFVIESTFIKSLRFNKKKATLLSGNQGFFGIGLYSNSPLWVTQNKTHKRLFSHHIHHWSIHPIQVTWEEKKKANKLRLSKKVIKKVTADKELRKQQWKKVKGLLKKGNGPAQLNCWQPPLKSKIVSKFGSPRYPPNGKVYYHSGVDLRGWTGTPIPSAAIGEVVLAEHHIVPGNTVILSHGGQIYSRYMHLSKMNVKVGDRINRGDILGESGSTGRVEGPHLHWEVIWKGRRLNPHEFLNVWNEVCR